MSRNDQRFPNISLPPVSLQMHCYLSEDEKPSVVVFPWKIPAVPAPPSVHQPSLAISDCPPMHRRCNLKENFLMMSVPVSCRESLNWKIVFEKSQSLPTHTKRETSSHKVLLWQKRDGPAMDHTTYFLVGSSDDGFSEQKKSWCSCL